MRRSRTIAVAALAAVTVSATVAVAQGPVLKKTDPKDDLRGAAKGTFDFRLAELYNGRTMDVGHYIQSWYADASRIGSIRLELDTDGQPGVDFYVKRSGTRVGSVYNATTGARVARSNFVKHSSKDFTLAFDLAFAGNPASYKFRWRRPGRGTGSVDLLPNRGFLTHRPQYRSTGG